MDNHLMQSFYETIKEKNYSHSSLKSYLEMLENLPSYRAKYLKEKLEKKHLEPFKEVKIWDEKKEKKFAVVLDDFIYTDTNLKTYHFAIDIWINPDSTLPSLSIFERERGNDEEKLDEWKPIIEECIKNHANKTIKKLLYFNTKWNRFMCKESNQPNGEIYSEESDEYILEEIVPPILEMLKGLATTSQKE